MGKRVIDMGEQVRINIAVDKEIKAQAEEVLSDIGVDMQTAINMFMRQVIRTGGIPFQLSTRPSIVQSQETIKEMIERMNKEKNKL